jgi:cyclomaltodextrinase / maltogenic alpha-amylase / neopullulanase
MRRFFGAAAQLLGGSGGRPDSLTPNAKGHRVVGWMNAKSDPPRTTFVWALIVVSLIGGTGCDVDQASAGRERVAAATTDHTPTTADSDAAAPAPAWNDAEPMANVPAWAVDAVFYQIFPERFRNGDTSNDPTRDSLEFPDNVPASWAVSPWTGDWYARGDWEQFVGDNFFEHGVFNRRYGGDLQGVLDKLDYLQDLGVNTLYFNPVFYGRSLHKYDAASMHHIDPHFGPDPAGDLKLIALETSDPKSWHWTTADKLFLKLVTELHRRGMRVIIDGVFNHTGRDFFAFAHLREHQAESPYRDWYIVQHFDDPATTENEFRYKGWWGVETLPELADAAGGRDLHAGPKQYVFDVTRRWLDPDGDGDPRDGIDGWRLDVANEVPAPFWHEWHELVRRINPEAYTVAEIWDDAREFLTRGGFSATMNYHAFAFLTKGFLIDGRLSAHDFGRELQRRRQKYPGAMQFALQNLVDSHDTDRVASMIVNRPVDEPYLQADRFDYDVSPRHDPTYDVRRPTSEDRQIQRMIVLLQMTYLGAPMVYYGDEAGMWGGDDPCDRWPMLWQDLKYDEQTDDPLGRKREPDEMAFDLELFDFYRRAIGLRREHDVLRHGAWRAERSDDEAQFFAFSREMDDQQALVALNRGEKPFRWTLPENADKDLSVALDTNGSETSLSIENEGQSISVLVPRMTGILLLSP